MKAIYIILFSILLFSCNDSKEVKFLENFKNVKQFNRRTGYNRNNKVISSTDLYILTKSEALNEFIFNTDKKYFYGYKTKINNDVYLLSYCVEYTPRYAPTYMIVNWFDEYICLYQKGLGVVSKIKTTSSAPVFSNFKEKNGIYTIKSRIFTFRVEEAPINKSYFMIDSLITKYKIENDRFVEIK